MKILINLIMLFTAVSTFAHTTYNGRKSYSEAGSNDCKITVSKLDADKVELEIVAMGHTVKTEVNASDEQFTVETTSKGIPKENISISGILNNAVPVSFNMNTVEKIPMEDQQIAITDSLTCVFDQKSSQQ